MYASLKRRQDFLRLNREGRFMRSPSFILRAWHQTEDARTNGQPRLGLTITRKLGNSVVRHRIRRRLKEAARTGHIFEHMRSSVDYVLIAHASAAHIPFLDLQDEIIQAIEKVHRFLGRPSASLTVTYS